MCFTISAIRLNIRRHLRSIGRLLKKTQRLLGHRNARMSPREFPARFDFADIEQRWSENWASSHVYMWSSNEPRAQSYVIDTPPPTVSGALHIGHVFSYTQTDIVARFFRMRGRNVFYPMGFDDNGLPTERLVEKVRGITASKMSREEFIAVCYEVVEDAEIEFRRLFRRIGLSIDLALEYQTISKSSRKISQLSIIDLYRKGHLTRRPQPTLWDPVDRTALAQAEVVERELPGVMHQIRFAMEDGSNLVVASTRPELLGACVAVLYHPENPRASALAGHMAFTPLFEVPVPLVADEQVDPEKGTGFVMCCTFGDVTDIEWWRQYDLPLRTVIDTDGRLLPLDELGSAPWPSRNPERARTIGAQLAGMKVKAARQRIAELLADDGKLVRKDDIHHAVPCAERSGAPLEILVTPQWFVRLLDKKDALIEIGREIKWHPEFMRERYESWVTNLKWDWCISRQRYFGVPLPFWYSKRPGEEGKVIAAEPDDLPVNPLVDLPRGYGRDEVVPDSDVMDTWATSSVSPQINSRAISEELALDIDRHRKLFPASLRPQAHEIIRTWAFYTIAKSLLHVNSRPFDDIAISGWCLTEDRSKMSKSKGTSVDPNVLLDRHGTDPVRYWTATSKLGQDTVLSEAVIQNGRRLVTKLWNASRFVDLQLRAFRGDLLDETTPRDDIRSGRITEILDKALISNLGRLIETATSRFEAYEYAEALREIERFFWSAFCDNHLELVKARAYGDLGDPSGQASAIRTLRQALGTILHLFAPFVPFVTEEIHSLVFPDRESVHRRGGWPNHEDFPRDEAAEQRSYEVVQILSAIRKFRSQMAASLKVPLAKLSVARAADGAVLVDIGEAWPDLRSAANYQQNHLDPLDGISGDRVASDDKSFLIAAELVQPH